MSNPSDKTNTLASKVYDDIIHPSAKTTGEILGFIPRSIKVLLQSWEKWIINGEESTRLTSEAIKQKIEAIPEDRLTEPEAYIVVPAIQQLGYSYSSEELRELYANLIVSSMDTEKKEQVHPAFVDILKKLTPDEAKIIQYLKGVNILEYVDLKGESKENDGGFIYIERRITLLRSNVSFSRPENELAYLENLVCLGILKDCDTLSVAEKDNYKRIEENLGLEQLRSKYTPETYRAISVHRSIYQVTKFGENFIKAVVA